VIDVLAAIFREMTAERTQREAEQLTFDDL
jgi:hypothetical protein